MMFLHENNLCYIFTDCYRMREAREVQIAPNLNLNISNYG